MNGAHFNRLTFWYKKRTSSVQIYEIQEMKKHLKRRKTKIFTKTLQIGKVTLIMIYVAFISLYSVLNSANFPLRTYKQIMLAIMFVFNSPLRTGTQVVTSWPRFNSNPDVIPKA